MKLFEAITPRTFLWIALIGFCYFQPHLISIATPSTSAVTPVYQKITSTTTKPLAVDLITLLKQPKLYLHKSIVFSGQFSSFSSLGLDYKPALRESKNNVALLFFRPDALPTHKIPLAEMKLFIHRTESEKLPDLETNDLVTVEATPFSNALGDVWLDVNHLTITQKAPRKPKD